MARYRTAVRQPGIMSIESVRAKLPVRKYLCLLDHAATTGYLPKLNEFGRPIPFSDLTPGEQMDCSLGAKERTTLLQYLVDKSMPSVKALEITNDKGADQLATAPSDARRLATRSLMAAASQPDVADRTQEDDPDVREAEDVTSFADAVGVNFDQK